MKNPLATIIANPYEANKGFKLSENLLNKQDAWDNLEEIKRLHLNRLRIENDIKNTDDSIQLKILANEFVENEFVLQDAWKFPRNGNFHKWWYLPKCTCAKMDNDDNYPYGYYSRSGDCPLHS